MSPRRIHPRHVTGSVSVSPVTSAGDGVTVTTGTPVTVPCQVEHTIKLVPTDTGPLVASVLTLRVPPRAAADELAIFTPDSPVVHRGQTSWVLTTAPVVRAGVLAYTQVVTGELAARFGGAWLVQVRITPTRGRDRYGDPLPPDPPREVTAWLKPGTTKEPVDFDQSTATTATLYLANTETVTATTRVDVLDSPLAGRWLVDGDPHPDGAALAVPIRRS